MQHHNEKFEVKNHDLMRSYVIFADVKICCSGTVWYQWLFVRFFELCFMRNIPYEILKVLGIGWRRPEKTRSFKFASIKKRLKTYIQVRGPFTKRMFMYFAT